MPTKAFGIGKVSSSPRSSSMSSKLLVSTSLLSSGTTGAAAAHGTWRWKIHDDAGKTEPVHYINKKSLCVKGTVFDANASRPKFKTGFTPKND